MIILNEAYPDNFSFDVLEGLNSFSKRKAYVRGILQFLGGGSSREVYALDDERVLKVAKNSKGLVQNRAEIDYELQKYSCIAKIFEVSDDDKFIVMERAKKVSKSVFKQLSGVSLEDFEKILLALSYDRDGRRYGGREYKNYYEEFGIEDNEWLSDFIDIVYNWNYPIPGDFVRLSTYGVVERDGKKELVLVDFGFNREAEKVYFPNRR